MRSNHLLFVFLFLLFAIFTGGLIYVFSLFLIFILLAFVVASVPLYIAWRRQTIDVFEPIVFKSVFMYMILIALIERMYFSDDFLRHQELISFTFDQGFLLLSILYLLLFSSIMVGYYYRASYLNRMQKIMPTSSEMRLSLTQKIAIAYMLIGFFTYMVLLGNALGWNPLYLYTTTEPRSEIFSGGGISGILRIFVNGAYIGFFIYIATLVGSRKNPQLRHFTVFGLVILMFSLLGGRGKALQILLIFIIIMYYLWIKELITVNRRHFRIIDPTEQNLLKIVILPLIAIPIGVITLAARYLRLGYGFIESVSQIDYFRILTFGINNDQFDYFLILASSDEINKSLGTRYLRVPLNFVPRSIWPEKPPMYLGSEIREIVIPDGYGGRPPGEIGYYFAEFGYPGIILLGVLYGLLLRFIYELLLDNSRSPLALIIYPMIMVPLVVSGLTNGALWTVMNHLLWLAPVLFVHRHS